MSDSARLSPPESYPRAGMPVLVLLLAVVVVAVLFIHNDVVLGLGLAALGGWWTWLWWRLGHDDAYLRWSSQLRLPLRRLQFRPAVRGLDDDAWAERDSVWQRRTSLYVMVPVGVIITIAGVSNLIVALLD